MKIANIDLGDKPVMLAPMEDVTDASFRLICKEMGCDLTYTEFVSADALIRNIAATTRKLEINPAERPTAIQIYGREPEVMAQAARIAAEARPDFTRHQLRLSGEEGGGQRRRCRTAARCAETARNHPCGG